MTSYDTHDTSADSLVRLMTLAPDPDRAARVRVKCRAQLARSRPRATRTHGMTEFVWRVLAPAAVGAFGVFYVAALVVTTLQLAAIFQ